MNQEESLVLTQQSNDDRGAIKLTAMKPDFLLSIHGDESKKLLTILPNGDVVTDDVVTASEAGRVFIESMMMNGKPLLSRIQELEEENELLKQKIQTYEVHQDNQVY